LGVAGEEGAAGDVGVSAEVFGGGVEDEIAAVIERALEDGGGPGVVGDDERADGVGLSGDGGEIGEVEEGVGGRLGEDEGGSVGLEGAACGVGVVEGGVDGAESSGVEELGEEGAAAVVDVVGEEDGGAGWEGLKEGVEGSGAGGEAGGVGGAFEGGEAGFEGAPVGVAGAAVEVGAEEVAAVVAGEGGGEVDGGCDGACGGVGLASGVNGEGVEVVSAHGGVRRWTRATR
jgi:hypothetical protein